MVRWVAVLVALCACSADPTQVILVVDTDMNVPSELDAVRITVVGPDGEIQSTEGPLVLGDPRTLAQTHTGGPLGPFRATVQGLLAGIPVVTRHATFDFQRERRLALSMTLRRACRGVACGAEETCADGGCRSVVVAPEELRPWRNPRSGVDACVPMEEVCNDRDDDCDGLFDEATNKLTDPTNCGGCGVVCTFMNGSGTCQNGDCVLIECDEGFADCDADGESCEVNTRTNPDFCGDCLTECGNPDRDCCDGVCGRC